MQEYPKWKYHRLEQPRIVHDPGEEAALGPGWEETPAAFDPRNYEVEPDPRFQTLPQQARKQKK